MRGHIVRTVTAAVLGTALVALSSACTSSPGRGPGAAWPDRVGAPTEPAYQGPALPGLEAKPLWSSQLADEDAARPSRPVFALGPETVVVFAPR